MKVAELDGVQLDYWVARAEGLPASIQDWGIGPICAIGDPIVFSPSGDWAQGGPIIEREKIDIRAVGDAWEAGFDSDIESDGYGTSKQFWIDFNHKQTGQTPLIAAMRAFVARKFSNSTPDE